MSNLLFILTGVVAAPYAALFFFPGLVPVPLRPSALGPTASAPPIPPQTATSLAPNAPTPTPTATVTSTRPRSSTPIEAIPTSTGTPTPTPTVTQTGTPTNTPTPSRYPYTVQRGYPIYSAAISLETFNDCKRNLITLNFVQNH